MSTPALPSSAGGSENIGLDAIRELDDLLPYTLKECSKAGRSADLYSENANRIRDEVSGLIEGLSGESTDDDIQKIEKGFAYFSSTQRGLGIMRVLFAKIHNTDWQHLHAKVGNLYHFPIMNEAGNIYAVLAELRKSAFSIRFCLNDGEYLLYSTTGNPPVRKIGIIEVVSGEREHTETHSSIEESWEDHAPKIARLLGAAAMHKVQDIRSINETSGGIKSRIGLIFGDNKSL